MTGVQNHTDKAVNVNYHIRWRYGPISTWLVCVDSGSGVAGYINAHVSKKQRWLQNWRIFTKLACSNILFQSFQVLKL